MSAKHPSSTGRARRAALFLAPLFVACAGEDVPMTDMDITMGNPDVLVGTFQVNLVAPSGGSAGHTSVVGKVSDGPTPAQLQWTPGTSLGVCRLLKPRVPFCNQTCSGGQVCVADDKCQGYPKAQSVGSVRVSGLMTAAGATEFTMNPIAGNYQPPAGVTLPYPAFTESAKLRFEASGGAYKPFVLESSGIPPLELKSTMITIAPGQAVPLQWTAPGAGSSSQIHVKLDISHHGGSKGMLECDAPDTGSLELPAALVTELYNLGTAGFPTVLITRSAPTGSAVIAPGRVDLSIVSTVEREVQVQGVVSCNDSAQCPRGQTCQPDLTCK